MSSFTKYFFVMVNIFCPWLYFTNFCPSVHLFCITPEVHRHKVNGRRDLIRSDVSEHRGGRVMAGICLLDRMHVGDSEKREKNEKNVFFLEWDKEMMETSRVFPAKSHVRFGYTEMHLLHHRCFT